jgi:hypothetical protein
MSAKTCQDCGASFTQDFVLSLDEALRTGTIVRGMDVDEVDTQEGEAMADGEITLKTVFNSSQE